MHELAFTANETIFYYTVGGELRQGVDVTVRCAQSFEGAVEIDAGGRLTGA